MFGWFRLLFDCGLPGYSKPKLGYNEHVLIFENKTNDNLLHQTKKIEKNYGKPFLTWYFTEDIKEIKQYC